MIKTVVGAALFSVAVAAPAAAQDRAARDPDSTTAMTAMQDPAQIEAIADMLQGITAAVLQMPMRPIADAVRRVNPHTDLDRLPDDATIGDIADRDGGGDIAGRVGEQARTAGYLMGDVTRQLAVMMPVITAMARDMAAQTHGWIDDAPRRARR